MLSIVLSHSKRLLRPITTEHDCKCQTRENYPLQNQCLTPNLMYQDDVENNSNKGTKICFGLVETSFKEQFQNNNKDFNHEYNFKRKRTEL